jgi:anti-sigma factor RsiW
MKEHDPLFISRYVDGELDARSAARVERHLAECLTCRAVRDDLRAVGARVAAFETVTDEVGRRRSLAGILARGAAPPRGVTIGKPAFSALVVGLVAAGVGVGALWPGRSPAPTTDRSRIESVRSVATGEFDASRFDGGQRLAVIVVKHGGERREAR